MPESKDPKKVSNNDLRNSQFGGGFINAENVNAQRIGGDIWNFFLGQQTTSVGNPARPPNQRRLLADVKIEVIARLKQSLHNAVLINLGKELQPQQVKRPWDAEIKIGDKPPEPLADTTSILEVFDDSAIAGRLLILGAPGSGKTTTYLELAQALIQRAEEQPLYPIPVLFNLSSWKDECQSIVEWLENELKSKYGVPTELSKNWLENCQLLPMLDGLDELATNRQESCVLAINQLLQSEYRPQSLIVCSRHEEYNTYETKFQINGAICLQALSEVQIQNYLIDVGQKQLWQTLQNDSTLLELAKTPLLLSISVISANELNLDIWHKLSSTEAKIEHFLDAYTRKMLSREFPNTAYARQKTPSIRQTQYWLAYLAFQLNQSNSSEFLIERMQFSWIGIEYEKLLKLHELFCFILFCPFLFILVSPFLKDYLLKLLSDLLIFKLIFEALIPLAAVFSICLLLLSFVLFLPLLEKSKIVPVEEIEHKLNVNILSFSKVLIYSFLFFSIFGLISQSIGSLISTLYPTTTQLINGRDVGSGGMIVGFIIGLLIGLYLYLKISNTSLYEKLQSIFTCSLFGGMLGCASEASGWLNFGLSVGLIIGASYFLIKFIMGFEFKSELEYTSIIYPNDGIWKSLRHALYSLVISILSSVTISTIISIQEKKTIWDIANSIGSGLSFGLMIGSLGFIIFGGRACIQHFVLRLILYRKGYIPWNYARFLDYTTERLFLQRVGGRYRFMHKMLQEHFAKMQFEQD